MLFRAKQLWKERMKNTLTALQVRFILGLNAVFYFLRHKVTLAVSKIHSVLQAFSHSRAVNTHKPLEYSRLAGNIHKCLALSLSLERLFNAWLLQERAELLAWETTKCRWTLAFKITQATSTSYTFLRQHEIVCAFLATAWKPHTYLVLLGAARKLGIAWQTHKCSVLLSNRTNAWLCSELHESSAITRLCAVRRRHIHALTPSTSSTPDASATNRRRNACWGARGEARTKPWLRRKLIDV